MKIKGQRPGAPKPRIVVIERDDEKFVFTINAVLNYTEFDKVCPEPKPPRKMVPGGRVTSATNEPSYIKALEAHGTYKTHWTILKALEDTEDLEWEQVKMDDPDTWHLHTDEMRESGLTEGEIAYLVNEIYANLGVDEDKMTQARERFIRSQEVADR